MEAVYCVGRSAPPEPPPAEEGPPLCSLSSGNVLAFTSRTRLDDPAGRSWGCHVYVCDIDTPWRAHLVASPPRLVTALAWDQQGRRLLVADLSGDVAFYASKDRALNDWARTHQAPFPGERVVEAAFFHSGRKVVVQDKKQDQTSSQDRFQHVKFAPSVRRFGGVAAEGALFVTATGMVGAVSLPSESAEAPAARAESLGSTRGYVAAADICHGKNGHFLIAATSGDASHAVQCYRVSVKRQPAARDEPRPLAVVSQALPSFFLGECGTEEVRGSRIARVRWASREDADALIVAVNGPPGRGGRVESWGLVERALPVHSLLAKGAASPGGASERFNTVLWQHQCGHRFPSARIVSLTSSKTQTANSGAAPYAFVTLDDDSVHCLFRDSLKQACSASATLPRPSAEGVAAAGGTPPKQIKYGPQLGGQGGPGSCVSAGPSAASRRSPVAHCDASWLGCALAAVDESSRLYLYRLPQPATDAGTPAAVYHATTLLEYSMVTGFDHVDLLISLRPSAVTPVYERFTDNFLRQSAAWQQFHYAKWLGSRAALLRMSPVGQARASDLTSSSVLHSVATAFKSLLRPSDLASHDKGPAESLAAVVVSERATPTADIDKVLMHLEAKEFTVEPSALQSVQQLIQWVAEIALCALARLPTSGAGPSHGYELLRDPSALGVLRELLVVVRVWGLLRPNCLPVFTRSSESVDVLAVLYRLLTRLAHNGCEPDDALLEECAALPSLVLVPQIEESLPRTCVASPHLHCRPWPLRLEFGTEPDSLLGYAPDLPPLEGGLAGCPPESVRHLRLGARPSGLRRCGRCGAVASRQLPQRTAAIRSWDQRWVSACRCGGPWTLCDA